MELDTEVIRSTNNNHFENLLWQNELNFRKREVSIYEQRLEFLVTNNSHKRKMLPELEHFQNQFIRQKEVIDELNHEINVHEPNLQSLDESTPEKEYDEIVRVHKSIKSKFKQFRKLYKDLKKDYKKFVLTWM